MRQRTFYLAASSAVVVFLLAASAQAGLTYEQTVLSDSPVGYWQFEETAGSQADDSSGNLLHGTYTGGVTLGAPGVTGIGGNAAVFDGSSGYVQLPGAWGGTGWPAATIEAWVYNASPPPSGFQAIVSATSTRFAHFQLHSNPTPSAQTGAYTSGGFAGVPTISSTATGTWRHIVLVAESGNTRLYEDGLQVGSANTTPFTYVNDYSDVHIGNGYANTRWFNGQLDEVAIYNTALTDQRVMDHYIAGQAEYVRNVVASEPIVYYKLHEAGVGHTSRAGNYGTAGSVMNGTYLIMGGSGGAFVDVPSAYDPLNFAKQFDGTHTFVGVPAAGPAAAAVPQFSVEFWMKPDNYNAGLKALYAGDGWDSHKLHLNLSGSNLELAINGYSTFPHADLAPYAALDEWSHIVVTYDVLSSPGNYIAQYYVNGELIDTVTAGGSLAANFNTTGSIGAWYNGSTSVRFFDGALGDVALYPYVLSANQVYIHFNGVPEPSTALLAMLGAAGLGLVSRRRRRRA